MQYTLTFPYNLSSNLLMSIFQKLVKIDVNIINSSSPLRLEYRFEHPINQAPVKLMFDVLHI